MCPCASVVFATLPWASGANCVGMVYRVSESMNPVSKRYVRLTVADCPFTVTVLDSTLSLIHLAGSKL